MRVSSPKSLPPLLPACLPGLREFLELGYKYDNLLMEESGQILEIETFIPMLLQRQDHGVNRLKRVILIGDHHQLPPVVKNMAIQVWGGWGVGRGGSRGYQHVQGGSWHGQSMREGGGIAC